jgi:2-polyprenyl-3-methyl-5-hydroxy-6-metoxy-1,4-benzoquinol methylase
MLRPYRERTDNFYERFEDFSSQLIADTETGHLKFDPMPPDDLLYRFYNGTFTREELLPTPEKEFNAKVFDGMTLLKKYFIEIAGFQDDFTFHDVGCGFGGMVWAAHKLGIRASGNEANRAWVDAANLHCNGTLSAEPLEQCLSKLPYKIDGFFCAHVLEHLPDPLTTLKLMAKYMSDEGAAYICLPNIHNTRTLRCGMRNHGCFGFPVHLHYFTPKSLVAMIREAGLEPVQVETRSMFDDRATKEDCDNLHAWEVFMLAVKPGNTKAKRHADLDIKCEAAFRSFIKAFPPAIPTPRSGGMQFASSFNDFTVSDPSPREKQFG